MTNFHWQLKQIGLFAGALISLSPVAVSAAAIAPSIQAQASQNDYQTYQSQRLNFKIAIHQAIS